MPHSISLERLRPRPYLRGFFLIALLAAAPPRGPSRISAAASRPAAEALAKG